MTRGNVIPNEEQKTSRFGGGSERLLVTTEALHAELLPDTVTRLGQEKVEFLAKGIGGLRRGMKVLELFGGSNLSTAVIAGIAGEKNLTSLDLRYCLNSEKGWRYAVSANYGRASEALKLRGVCRPSFVAAEAGMLPFFNECFEFVIAPDPPRPLAGSRAGPAESPSQEEAESKRIFSKSAKEALRVLKNGGIFVATAPLSWARTLRELEFKRVQFFSSQPLGADVTRISIGKKLQFKTKDTDPVVYIRCVR